MSEMIEVLRRYDFSHQRRLSFEYTMFKGVNDSIDDARKLVKALNGLSCRVNLIRFHAIPDSPLRPVPEERMTEFRDWLTSHGVFATIRASRGEDIWAACGMLSTSEQEKNLTNFYLVGRNTFYLLFFWFLVEKLNKIMIEKKLIHE